MQLRESKPTVRFIILMVTIIVFGSLLVFIGLLALGNQAIIMIMQTDTLDKLNEISVLIEAVEPEASEEQVFPLTDAERDLIIRVVMAEARGDGYVGMLPVAQTILDRATLWGMTVTEIVTAPGQYADPYPGEITFEAQLAVSDVFDLGVRAFEEPTTHFAEGKPYWTVGKTCRGSVGRHSFWY